MMVRNFLRIGHIVGALVFAMATHAQTGASNPQPSMRAQINTFMDGYAHDLVKRLGSGSRVEYDRTSQAANAETRICAKSLTIGVHNQQALGNVTLLVACGSEWSMYVPIDLNVYRPVVVATKPLASGAVIGSGDVELSAFEISQLAGTYLTTLDGAVGMGVKRPITMGRPIFAQQLEQPLMIRRGEGVMISAESGELAVKMTGTALTDGRRGDLIRIKNRTSARVVDARVIGPGQVVVAM